MGSLRIPLHLGIIEIPMCPMSDHWKSAALLKSHMPPKLVLWISCCSRRKRPSCASLSEFRTSLSLKTWAEVSSSNPHLLQTKLSTIHGRWRCFLRVLCPVSNEGNIEPMHHSRSQAPRHTIGPPTNPHHILSFLQLNIHVFVPHQP